MNTKNALRPKFYTYVMYMCMYKPRTNILVSYFKCSKKYFIISSREKILFSHDSLPMFLNTAPNQTFRPIQFIHKTQITPRSISEEFGVSVRYAHENYKQHCNFYSTIYWKNFNGTGEIEFISMGRELVTQTQLLYVRYKNL